MKTLNTSEKPGKYLKKRPGKLLSITAALLCVLLLFAASLCFFAARWYLRVYGDTGFDSIVFTLAGGVNNVESELLWNFVSGALVPAVACAVALVLLLFSRLTVKGVRVWPFSKTTSRLTALVLSLVMLTHAAVTTGLPGYVYGLFKETPIFEEQYVDPNSVNITFPEEKRNLIYIYLESMENTFLSQELGGVGDVNLIPELYTLAAENLNFSQNEEVGGFRSVTGTTWTIAAMVAHTAGVPLKTPPGIAENDYGQNGTGFLPGITTITDILDEAGYYQTLMVGSVASFGGRKEYFTQHGADYIYELTTARRDGIVPGDYFVWWGMEDKYLFEYAKQELLEISQKEEPFAFSMLTVDTHHIGGYVCEYCDNTREEQYENVMSCSSRQVAAFVAWLQQQDFYENTTIVITGDHPSMDNGYFQRNVDEDYTRRIYNCFINAPLETAHNKNREFSSLDMFPTTLAALGCKIEGNRLGLGTNLFSGVPTLVELMGFERFDRQISMASEYYATVFRQE